MITSRGNKILRYLFKINVRHVNFKSFDDWWITKPEIIKKAITAATPLKNTPIIDPIDFTKKALEDLNSITSGFSKCDSKTISARMNRNELIPFTQFRLVV